MPKLALKDRANGNQIFLSLTDGKVTGVMGSEPNKYLGLTEAEARRVAASRRNYVARVYRDNGEHWNAVCGSEKQKRKTEIYNRAQVIAWLGLAPEGKAAGDKYPASTHEFAQDLKERHSQKPGLQVLTIHK